MAILKAAMFDMDGTVIETEGIHFRAWAEAMKLIGEELGTDEYSEVYAGKEGIVIATEIIRGRGIPMNPKHFLKARQDILVEMLNREPINLMPYAMEAVRFFHNYPEVDTALVTTSPYMEAFTKLERAGIRRMFDAYSTRGDVKNVKPSPECYLIAAERLSVNPSDSLAFEDTESGIISAKDAGLCAVAVPNRYSQNQDFSRADAVVRNLGEGLEWAKKRYNL